MNSSRLVVWMLYALAPAVDREAIIGDVIESASRAPDPRAARNEMWRQLFRSLPHLLLRRIQSNRGLSLIALLLVVYPLLLLWWELAFGLFRLVYTTNLFQGSVPVALTVRMLLESSGYLAAGAGAAWLHQRFELRISKVFLACLAWLLFCGPSTGILIAGQAAMPTMYLLARVALALPIAVIGFRLWPLKRTPC